MPTNKALFEHYATKQDALEDLRNTLTVEEPYANLFEDEQKVFHDWVFENAGDYVDDKSIDWVGAFYDWSEG